MLKYLNALMLDCVVRKPKLKWYPINSTAVKQANMNVILHTPQISLSAKII